MWKKQWLLLYNNMQPHTTIKKLKFLAHNEMATVPQSPYSTNLSSVVFFFPTELENFKNVQDSQEILLNLYQILLIKQLLITRRKKTSMQKDHYFEGEKYLVAIKSYKKSLFLLKSKFNPGTFRSHLVLSYTGKVDGNMINISLF